MSSGSKAHLKQRNSKNNNNNNNNNNNKKAKKGTNNNTTNNNNHIENNNHNNKSKLSSSLGLDSSSSSSASNQNNLNKKSFNNKNNKIKMTNSHCYSNLADKDEIAKYVLWRRPIQTIYYFIMELIHLIIYYLLKILTFKKCVMLSLLSIALITIGFYTDGSHLPILLYLRKKTLWCLYWLGLGIASSIGLGTGLHTFLLYLGPFIAQVTLAAYECNSLNFPEPPYPDEILCPTLNQTDARMIHNNEENLSSDTATATALVSTISILSIMAKVRLESFMWGAGTAIGELPPYFMARASALSKNDLSEEQDEELAEFEQLLKAEQDDKNKLSFADRARLTVFKLIKRVGFLGILLCASIPNPLFDLAGITCGHFLVKFSTFFGATLIGKAVIKMHIQKMFVIFLFSQHHLDNLFGYISKLPYVGDKIQPLFQEWLNSEKSKFNRDKLLDQDDVLNKTGQPPSESILSFILSKIVLAMILFFIVSIINSLAQKRYKRLNSHLPYGTTKVAND